MPPHAVTRRKFVESSTLCLAGAAVLPGRWNFSTSGSPFPAPLEEFGYDQVSLNSEIHETQFQHSISVLMGLNEDSLLKPMRQMAASLRPGRTWAGGITTIRIMTGIPSTPASHPAQPTGNGFQPWLAP